MLAKTHVDLEVECPVLLSDFNQNWNVLTNLSKTSVIFQDFFLRFSLCYVLTDGQT